MAEAGAQSIGPYRLIRKLAQGGMAEIWLANHPRHGEVVIKRVHPHLASNPDFLMMFLNEARIAARLDHPGCVQIFDLGKEGTTYYIAMAYIDGEDIRAIAKQARQVQVPLPRKLAVAILIGACEGLHYAHELRDAAGKPLNVVHRDVSPQNILVTFNGEVRIVDFGIAKAADQASRTRAGVLKGKYAYMAPEQILGVPLDRRADVFALGVLLYELTTGRRLFKAKNELETMKRITQSIFTLPTKASPGYPPDLETIVLKALQNDRINRTPSAAALASDLRAFLASHQVEVMPADLSSFMHQVFAERLVAVREAKAHGDRQQVLDARFGDESSESSGQAPAPPAAALSAESTAIDPLQDPLSPPTLTGFKRVELPPEASLPFGHATPQESAVPGLEDPPGAVPEMSAGVLETDLARTQLAPPVPDLLDLAGRTEGRAHATELAMSVTPSPQNAPLRQRRTEASLAVVQTPESLKDRAGPQRAARGGDARLELPSPSLLPDEGPDLTLPSDNPDPFFQAVDADHEALEPTWYDPPEPGESAQALGFGEPAPSRSGRGLLLSLLAVAVVGMAATYWVLRPGAAGKTPSSLIAVQIETTPSGASILLEGAPIRQRTPTTLTQLKPGTLYHIELVLPSHPPFKLAFDPGKIAGSPPRILHTFSETASPSIPDAPATAPHDAAAAPSEDPAHLSLLGKRSTSVWIDGERIGKLPIRRFSLPAGSHQILLRGRQGSASFKLRLSPGEALTRRPRLRRHRRR